MIYYFDSLESTNITLKELAKNNAKNFSLVWTKNQTKGKGYLGNTWQSKVGENLTFSLLIINTIHRNEQVFLNMWVCIVLRQVIAQLILKPVCIKWPNDILVNQKKIAGILIESQTHQFNNQWIVGIGLNVNQTSFEHLPNASSIFLHLNKQLNLEALLTDVLAEFKANYQCLENREFQKIQATYLQHLFKKDKVASFKINNQIFNGIIRGVNQEGNLIVELENEQTQVFQHKEIQLLY